MGLEQVKQYRNNVKEMVRPKERHGFQARFLRAFRQPPIQGILFANGDWTPLFLEGVEKVDAACRQRQICDHGLGHIMQVSENALILMDAVQANVSYSVFSDAEVLFPVLLHDMGYGFKTVAWQGQHATNHPERGADVMERFGRQVLSKTIDSDHQSLQILQKHAPLYHAAISGTTMTMLTYVKECMGVERITPQMFFPLIVMVADKLDYFRDERVDGLKAPRQYEDNPYFFLADAIQSYEVTCDENKLRYMVTLKKNFYVPSGSGGFILDFRTWQAEAMRHYGAVWTLIEAFANLLGKGFLVLEERTSPGG